MNNKVGKRTYNASGYTASNRSVRRGFYEEPSNIVTGLMGAIIGVILGGIIEVVLFQVGLQLVAPFADIAVVLLAMMGYKLLGRAFDLKGAVACSLVGLFAVGAVHRITWFYKMIVWYIKNKINGIGMNPASPFHYISLLKLRDVDELKIYYIYVFAGYFFAAATVYFMIKKKSEDC
ncbi:MAG: hypothetical protein J1E62_06855 [Lachnospiraceae bacterium]|nr:hypothetical protein [Lachnospiraceae bacterium]